MANYSPLRFGSDLQVGLPEEKVDLKTLERAHLGGIDGELWHFRHPETGMSFRVEIGGRRLHETLLGDSSIGREYTSEEKELAMLFAIKEAVAEAWIAAKEKGQRLDLSTIKDHPVEVTYSHLRKAYERLNETQWGRGKQWILSVVEKWEERHGLQLSYREEKNGSLIFMHDGERMLEWHHRSFVEDCAPEAPDEPKHPAVPETQAKYRAQIEAAFIEILKKRNS